jgi:hypothetical protein
MHGLKDDGTLSRKFSSRNFEGVGRQCIAESEIDFCSSAVLFGHGSDGVKAPRNGAFYVGK